ncbi:MAG: hypothetical protein ABW328_16290 [Ilumatobacteraceae bacterium]
MTDLAAYAALPLEGPHDPTVGHALITMVEPHPGHELAYNRWYESDHFITGAMVEPWLFAGRRWTATYDLQELRYPVDSTSVVEPITKGCYLGTYWITTGQIQGHKAWTFSANKRLSADDRINHDRDHAFTSFQDKAGTVYAGDDVPRDVFSLMDPAPGLVLEVVDAPSADERDDLERWLLEDYLPGRVTADQHVSSAMVWRTNGPDDGMKPEVKARLAKVANGGRRLTILWFLTVDPRKIWADHFSSEVELVAAGGQGEVALVAPFIPSKMGTDTYVDQLRAPSKG